MRYNQLIENNNTEKFLYHGDNFETKKLDPKWMMHDDSRNAVGVGIYFTPDIEHTKVYGNKISKISMNGLKLINGFTPIGKIINQSTFVKFLETLNKTNEGIYYLITDYGIEVSDQSDIRPHHFLKLYNFMKPQEIRDWQIELAQATSTIDFVTAWNNIIKIDGLYDPATNYYAIINTNIPVTPVNF